MARDFIPKFYECRGVVITAAEYQLRKAARPGHSFLLPGEDANWVPMTQAEMDAESARVRAKWAEQTAADARMYRKVRAEIAKLAALSRQRRR